MKIVLLEGLGVSDQVIGRHARRLEGNQRSLNQRCPKGCTPFGHDLFYR